MDPRTQTRASGENAAGIHLRHTTDMVQRI